MDRQGVVETSEEHPELEDMDGIEIEVSSITTPSNDNGIGTCGSVHNIHPFRRNDSPAMSTAPHGAKLTAAIIAARRLEYDLEPGIGNDEPAKNIVIEHHPFPEPSPYSIEEVPDSDEDSDDEDYGAPVAVPDSTSNSDDAEVSLTFAVPDSSSDSDSNFTITYHAPDSDGDEEDTFELAQVRTPVSLRRKSRRVSYEQPDWGFVGLNLD
jgi:hypothetical protein